MSQLMITLTRREKILVALLVLFIALSVLFASLHFSSPNEPHYSAALKESFIKEMELLSDSLNDFVSSPTIERFWLIQLHTSHAFALTYVYFIANLSSNQQISDQWGELGKTLNPLETRLASYIKEGSSHESLIQAAFELKLLQAPLQKIVGTMKQWEQAPNDPIKAAEFYQSVEDLHLAVDKLNP